LPRRRWTLILQCSLNTSFVIGRQQSAGIGIAAASDEKGSDDGVQFGKDLVVGESDNPQVLSFQVFLTIKVVLALIVVTRAIEFDHQPVFVAVKIDKERPDRVLTARLDSTQTPATNRIPQAALGKRDFLAKFPAAEEQLVREDGMELGHGDFSTS
jgi:hypothetical protein